MHLYVCLFAVHLEKVNMKCKIMVTVHSRNTEETKGFNFQITMISISIKYFCHMSPLHSGWMIEYNYTSHVHPFYLFQFVKFCLSEI